jgi:hypothetical protein
MIGSPLVEPRTGLPGAGVGIDDSVLRRFADRSTAKNGSVLLGALSGPYS